MVMVYPIKGKTHYTSYSITQYYRNNNDVSRFKERGETRKRATLVSTIQSIALRDRVSDLFGLAINLFIIYQGLLDQLHHFGGCR